MYHFPQMNLHRFQVPISRCFDKIALKEGGSGIEVNVVIECLGSNGSDCNRCLYSFRRNIFIACIRFILAGNKEEKNNNEAYIYSLHTIKLRFHIPVVDLVQDLQPVDIILGQQVLRL